MMAFNLLLAAQVEQAADQAAEIEPPPGFIEHWLPFVVTLIVIVVGLRALQTSLLRNPSISPERRLPRQVTMIVLVVLSVILLVVALPSSDRDGSFITGALKVQMLSLIGLAIAALLTMGSTTIAANALAGFMLRSVKSWKVGDFVRVGEYFGRVSERGLFHTEIQTEDRDLVTLPNMFLATNPVRVVRSSGTIISTELSLGYDVSHSDADRLLVRAAESAALEEPFVWIMGLGDFAVTYRVCGFHRDVRTQLSARSKLRASVLDTLHRAKIEIMSPTVMNQRPLDPAEPLIPLVRAKKKITDESAPEELVFDKADAAQQIDNLRSHVAKVEARVKELEKAAKTDEDAAAELETQRSRLAQAKEFLEHALDAEKAGDADEL